MSTYTQATAVKQRDSHTYTANFVSDWCIGSVPHGGYVTATLMNVVRRHFDTTLQRQNQPHTITLHLEFLRRTQTGLATFKVKDVKLGRQNTTIHISLVQDSREEVVGYLSNSNINNENGVNYQTYWQLHPIATPVTSFEALEAGTDQYWGERKEWPLPHYRKAATKIRSWFPRKGQHSPACLDMWYCFRDPQSRFTQESLGFVCDTFPQMIDRYLVDNVDIYSVDFEQKHSRAEQEKIMKDRTQMWYPTVLLNLDVKKALPEEGVKFLFVRLQSKSIKNGRYDLEILILDEEGELVAVSNHVCYAVSAARNLAARSKKGGESKL